MAVDVYGLWQNAGISPWSYWPIKVLHRASPQAQEVAHGYPWVFWQHSFVAGHQRKQ